MTYTVANLVDDTLAHLIGTSSDELNILGQAMSAQATDYRDNLHFVYDIGGAVPGVYLSVEDEAMYVLAVDDSTNTCTVLRGQHGSAAVAHASGVIINVDPPWPRWTVMQVLRDELRSWGPQVFRIATVSIDIQAGVTGYDLGDSDTVYSRVRVYRDPPPFIGSSGITWVNATIPTNQSWPTIPAELRQNAPTSAFPSGNAVILKSNALTVPSKIWVMYSKPFNVDDNWTDSADVVDWIGLDPSDLDIAAYGAAWRLLCFKQPRRLLTNIAGQPRSADEVPPLALMQSGLQFKEMRDSRLNDAEIRLLQAFIPEINVS